MATHQSRPVGRSGGPTQAAPSWKGPAHAMPEPAGDTTVLLPRCRAALSPDVSPFLQSASPVPWAHVLQVPQPVEVEPEGFDWSKYLLVAPWSAYSADLTWSAMRWPLVADDLWRIAHEDRTGVRRADSRVIGLGLAAALLSELTLAGQIDLAAGQVCLTADVVAALTTPAAVRARQRFGAASILPDRIADELLTIIFDEAEPLPVETWLEYLASRAAAQVARRLFDAGHVTRASSWRGLHRQVVYQPVDDAAAAWPAARLLLPLQGARADDVDVILLGLCRAMGLHRWLFAGKSSDVVAPLFALPGRLQAPFSLLWARLDGLVSASACSLR